MEMYTVTVYDIQNKFIAYSAPFPAVIGVFCEWGSLYILAGDRKVGDWSLSPSLTTLNTFLELSFIDQLPNLCTRAHQNVSTTPTELDILCVLLCR